MRPKSEIYTPKQDDEHPHHFHIRNYKDFKTYTLVDQLTRTQQKILRVETKH